MRVLLCPSDILQVDCGRDESMSYRDTNCCADLRMNDSEGWPRPKRWRETETEAALPPFCLGVLDLSWLEDKIRLIYKFSRRIGSSSKRKKLSEYSSCHASNSQTRLIGELASEMMLARECCQHNCRLFVIAHDGVLSKND